MTIANESVALTNATTGNIETVRAYVDAFNRGDPLGEGEQAVG